MICIINNGNDYDPAYTYPITQLINKPSHSFRH